MKTYLEKLQISDISLQGLWVIRNNYIKKNIRYPEVAILSDGDYESIRNQYINYYGFSMSGEFKLNFHGTMIISSREVENNKILII